MGMKATPGKKLFSCKLVNMKAEFSRGGSGRGGSPASMAGTKCPLASEMLCLRGVGVPSEFRKASGESSSSLDSSRSITVPRVWCTGWNSVKQRG